MKAPKVKPELAVLERLATSLEHLSEQFGCLLRELRDFADVIARANPELSAARKAIESERRLECAATDSMPARMGIEELAWRWACDEGTVRNRLAEANVDPENFTRADVAVIEAQHRAYREVDRKAWIEGCVRTSLERVESLQTEIRELGTEIKQIQEVMEKGPMNATKQETLEERLSDAAQELARKEQSLKSAQERMKRAEEDLKLL